jgi:hypothetical protein
MAMTCNEVGPGNDARDPHAGGPWALPDFNSIRARVQAPVNCMAGNSASLASGVA